MSNKQKIKSFPNQKKTEKKSSPPPAIHQQPPPQERKKVKVSEQLMNDVEQEKRAWRNLQFDLGNLEETIGLVNQGFMKSQNPTREDWLVNMRGEGRIQQVLGNLKAQLGEVAEARTHLWDSMEVDGQKESEDEQEDQPTT